MSDASMLRRISDGIGFLAWGLVALVLGWGVVVEPRFLLDVNREPAPVENLPPEWEGARVAVLGDWQLGMWFANEGMVERAVRRAVDEDVDAALLLGDFVYKLEGDEAGPLRKTTRFARSLVGAGIPTFAVLGNHDWGMAGPDDPVDAGAARRVRSALEELGVRVLENEAVALRPRRGGPVLHFVGIGARWPGRADPVRAFAHVPAGAPRIVFHHHPDTFARIAAGQAPTAVAGHTHGGQVRIPFLPHWSWLTFRESEEVHADGWAMSGFGEPGNALYVNRGIGFSTVPVRINCSPELTILELRRAPPAEAGEALRGADGRGLGAGPPPELTPSS